MHKLKKIDFESMRSIDLKDIDPDSLVDINSIIINTDLPTDERICDFIRQIENPYFCKCGNLIIKTTFSDTKETMADLLRQSVGIE